MCRSQATPASPGDVKESIVNVAVYSADARNARNAEEMEKRRGERGNARTKERHPGLTEDGGGLGGWENLLGGWDLFK